MNVSGSIGATRWEAAWAWNRTQSSEFKLRFSSRNSMRQVVGLLIEEMRRSNMHLEGEGEVEGESGNEGER